MEANVLLLYYESPQRLFLPYKIDFVFKFNANQNNGVERY